MSRELGSASPVIEARISERLAAIENLILRSDYDRAIYECHNLSDASMSFAEEIDLGFTLSRTYLGARKFEEALVSITDTILKIRENQSKADEVITREKFASFFTLKAQIHSYLGQYVEALHEATTASVMDNHSIGAASYKAQALRHLHRDEEAASELAKGVSIVTSGIFHGKRDIRLDLEKAFLARSCNEYDHAIKYSRYLVEHNPEYASGYIHLGINLFMKSVDVRSEGGAASASGSIIVDRESYDEAIKALDSALKLHPNDSVAYYYKGLAAEADNQEDFALEFYHRAAETSPGFASPTIALVNIHMNRGQTDHALEHIEALVAKNPTSEEALFAKAKTLAVMDRFEEAYECFQSLIEMNPENHYYHYRKAIVETALMRVDDAIESCRVAIELNPSDIEARHHLAITLSSVSRYDAALSIIDEVLKDFPSSAMAHQARGYIISEMAADSGEQGFAYYFKNYISDAEQSEYPDVIRLIESGKFADAEKWYYNSITEDNKHAIDLVTRAQELIEANKSDEAEPLLHQAIEINPRFVSAIFKLGKIFEEAKRHDDSYELLQNVPADLMPLLSSMEGGGNLPHVEKLMTESISSHDRAISFDDKNPLLYTSKASSLCKFHMLDDMIKCTADAERVMMEEADSILNPEQREYVKLQNEKRIELLREVTKLFEEARSFHQAIESYFKAGNTVHFDNSEEIHEGYDEVKIEESRVFSEVSSNIRHGALKRFHEMPSLRQLSGLREANYSFEADMHAEEESVHSPRGISSAAAGGGGRAGGWEGFSRDTEIHGIRSIRPKFDTIREASDEDEAGCDKPQMYMPRVKSHPDKIDAKLLLAAGSEKSTGGMFSPPKESTITSVANAALNPGRVDVSAKSSLKDELARSQRIPEPTSAAEAATLDLASEILERELKAGANLDEKEVKKISLKKIAEFVMFTKTTIDTVSSPAKSTLELQKQINKTHELQKQIDFLTKQLEMMQEQFVTFQRAPAHTIMSEDYEHRLDLSEIEKSPALREYYSGFVKTFQTMYMGFITRSSGEVESSKQTIGLSYIPLPPIVDNVVKAFETAVVTGLRIKKDNEATVSLQGVANPLDLMHKVIPMVACKLALHIKKDEIQSYIPEERHGIFKIMEFYDAIKSQVFEKMNLTSYAEHGAEDALKLLGAFRSGLVFVQNLSSPKVQAENILKIFTGDCFATELELREAEISDHSFAAAAAGGGGASAPLGSGALILGLNSSGSLISKASVDLSKYSKSGDLHSPYSSRVTDLSSSRSATTESAAVISAPPEVRGEPKTTKVEKSWWQNFKEKWCCCGVSAEDIAAAKAAATITKHPSAGHTSFKSVVPAYNPDTDDDHPALSFTGGVAVYDGE